MPSEVRTPKKPDINQIWDPGSIKKEPNHRVPIIVATDMIAAVNDEYEMDIFEEDYRM